MMGVFGLKETSVRCGYWISPQHRGHGISGRALELLSSWAFGALNLDALELLIEPNNVASIRTAETAGYSLERTLVAYKEIGGILRDMTVFVRKRPL
jgi:RimJ/RimL family protein N-acetyltransferase